jgi:hypothetical protein
LRIHTTIDSPACIRQVPIVVGGLVEHPKNKGCSSIQLGLGGRWIAQLDNHCCDLIDRIAPIANHGIDF